MHRPQRAQVQPRTRENRDVFVQHKHQQQESCDFKRASSTHHACHNNDAPAEMSLSTRQRQSRRQQRKLPCFLWLCSLTFMVLLLVTFLRNEPVDPYLMKDDVWHAAVPDPRNSNNHNDIHLSKTSSITQGDDKKKNTPLSSSSSFGSRDILIFNHNPKAGGGSIKDVLHTLRTHEIIPTGKAKLQTLLQKKPNRTAQNSYFLLAESAVSTKRLRQQGYIIGSIREPCSQYVSLWAFGSARKGLLQTQILFYNNTNSNNTTHSNFTSFVASRRKARSSDAAKDAASYYYGQDKPSFNTSKDIERFHRWMHHPLVQGIVGKRVKSIYGASGRNEDINGVDCFVYVEQFQSSLIDCLQKFEAQGGYIDWSTPLIASMLRSNKDIHNNNNHNNGDRIITGASSKRNLLGQSAYVKNDPLGNPQVLHHASCATYFHNASLTQEMENGPENFIYDTFGYQGCCSKAIRKSA